MLRHIRLTARFTDRRGAILIVVLAMLALFAIVGITFVMVASASAEKQRILRDAQANDNGPAITDNGENAFRQFLATLIYDVPDDATGLQNSLRGHSLADNMYGRYTPITGGYLQRGSAIAWNGVGNFSQAAAAAGVDRKFLVNYRQFPLIPQVYDPGISGERLVTGQPGSGAGSIYVPKNAPYTYPDINNFFLASICPATGEILVPSYHRQAAFGSLHPSNLNWTNAQGRYLTARPRPQEHPQFPRVAADADGVYRGDVKNLPGGYFYDTATGRFVGGNDSIWIDIGAPIMTGRDGRRYKMLVAPLILDLDGRVNLSVAGNRMKPVNSPPVTSDDSIHTSGVGLGPWEIGLERLFAPTFTQEARNLVFQRGLAQTRPGPVLPTTQKWYASRSPATQHLPSSSKVPWAGFNALPGSALTLPSYPGNPFAASPDYPGGCDCSNTLGLANHPTLFNPTEWPSLTSGLNMPRGYSLADTKLLSVRYAFAPSFYSGLDLASFAPNSLRGSTAVPTPNPPAFNTPNPSRLDPAHALRQLVTTLSADLDRPGLMPGRDQAVNPYGSIGPVDLNRTLADYRIDPTRRLLPANMGPANVPTGTLTPKLMTQADLDRNRLARDIFARLLVVNEMVQPPLVDVNVVTGAISITVDPAADPATYNRLRGLAQLAVNIVDYIDSDDVITSFVWKPLDPNEPYADANYAPTLPDVIGNHVVFGTEKPRLTINEVYAEAVNNPADPTLTMLTGPPATSQVHVRVWAEFQNASSTPYSGPGATVDSGPLGDGAVRLKYDGGPVEGGAGISPYRVEMVRNMKGGANVAGALRQPTDANYALNVKGDILGTTPDLIYNFDQAAALPATRVIPVPPAANPEGNPNPSKVVVAANFAPTTNWPEFAPTAATKSGWNVIDAAQGPGPGSFTLQSDLALGTSIAAGGNLATQYRHYILVLRRLANPNLPESVYNPYITVDVMDNIRVADRIYMDSDGNNTPRDPRSPTVAAGYDPNTAPAVPAEELRPQSSGKIQPYAAFSAALPTGLLMQFPGSMVQYQNPSTVGVGAEGVRHTLSRQNSVGNSAPTAATYTPGTAPTGPDGVIFPPNETLMTPYDWLVHLDRPLINQTELLHVSAGKPHELTLNFLVLNKRNAGEGRDVQKSANAAQFLPVDSAVHPFGAGHPYSLYPTLYRAFDLLRVQPYGHQTALGGRIAGKINLNTIQDKRIWDALFDVQNGNGFNQGQVDALWTALIQSRTKSLTAPTSIRRLADGSTTTQFACPVPGPTIYDMNLDNDGTNPYDRPFLPLGAATIAGPAGSTLAPGVTAFQAGIGLQDTFLRTLGGTDPRMWIGTGNDHAYQRAEMARKIMNNTTTVSNVFAVWVTVGYFEVTTPVGTAPEAEQWGKEYYFEVPGDMRQKMFALVDRTQIGVRPEFYQPFLTSLTTATPMQLTQSDRRPFYTTVEALSPAPLAPTQPTTPAGSTLLTVAVASSDSITAVIYSDGEPVTIDPANFLNNRLVVGTGADREIVQITGINHFTAATATTPFTVTFIVAPLARSHGPGESVSNIMPCNPGPQANFALPMDNSSPFRMVVPHWSRAP